MENTDQKAPRVLLVDDNPMLRDVLRNLFEAEDYLVRTSANGKEALEVLEDSEVDIIVCDILMPEMDGYELYDQVRAKADLSHVPFVFLTAMGSGEDVRHGKEVGADDYLVKPFDPLDLVSVVKGKLNRYKNIQDSNKDAYDKYRKKVVQTLSHEFRTPLVAINTGTELLMDNGVDLEEEKITRLLSAIKRGGERLERLVNDFMVLQKIDGGEAERQVTVLKSEVPVATIISELVERNKEVLKKQGIVLSQDVSVDEGTMVMVYAAHVSEVLQRILSNAVKFQKDSTNKVVEASAKKVGNEIRISISDRGVGFDLEKLDAAVDAFGQINREQMEQQGSGLGLKIASSFANINGGRLEFENRDGGGAVVTLILPIADK